MSALKKAHRLKKELSLLDVYAIATATTISGGFFLLPGLIAARAGSTVPLVYLIAVIPLIPALLSMIELSTAMPKAGGLYYFLDRSMGPLIGTIGGLGTWLALALKTAFALIGMGAYLELFFPELPLQPLAVGLALLFGAINLLGAKKTGIFQVILLVGLLLILGWFSISGMVQIESHHFANFFSGSFHVIFSSAGMAVVSYVGLTKIASVAEEVKNPEKTLPLGIFLALGTVIVIYEVGTAVMVGIVPLETLSGDLTPAASAANFLSGSTGALFITIAAILSFSAVANAGILSGSRYPLAMSRDHILPNFFRSLGKNRAPQKAIYATVVLIVLCLVLFDPTKIAKLGSAFLLLIFSLICLAIIVMRESHIESYDPGYRSPLYPWMHLFGIIAPLWLIGEMGWFPTLFIFSLLTVGIVWYIVYARKRVVRNGAIFHVFARLGKHRYTDLDTELRGILQEKGLRDQDPFDAIIASATLLDIHTETTFEEVVKKAAARLDKHFPGRYEILVKNFIQETRAGANPVTHGVALPHIRLADIQHPQLVMVRALQGIQIDIDDQYLADHHQLKRVYALFFLVSPEEDPGQHLRILAQIATHVETENFMEQWLSAKNEQEMKEILLRDEHFLSVTVQTNGKASQFIDRSIQELELPENCLIVLIHRNGNVLVPRGNTQLLNGDRLTIIGDKKGIRKLYDQYQKG